MKDFAISDDPRVQAQLDRLSALNLPQGRFGLETIRALLSKLGDPQNKLPPVFHVAGTNGKGSTCAFLRAMLEAAGHRVHVYTSPHLVRFNERIRLAGRLIEDDMLARLLKQVLDVGENLQPSFFEVSTAAMFLAFAEVPADVCVIEVGLGGRFDATNVVEKPLVCGIASLAMDHEAFLLADDTAQLKSALARIAFEKAGIAKRGAPLVTLLYNPAMNDAIRGQAAAAGTRVMRLGRDWNVVGLKTLRTFDYRGALRLPLPRLPGMHQQFNAGLAIAMLRHQTRLKVPRAAIAAGLERAGWPARLQRLGPGPLTALLPPQVPCWLDGGHNSDAGRALGRFFAPHERHIHLVIGMLKTKSSLAITLPLQFKLASVTVVPVPGHDHHDAAEFANVPLIPRPHAAPDVPAALKRLTVAPGQGHVVLIAGSLYLAGEVLRLNGELPD